MAMLQYGTDGKRFNTRTLNDADYQKALMLGIAKLIENGELKVKEVESKVPPPPKSWFEADYS